MADHSAMKLGKGPAAINPRAPLMAVYLEAHLPAPPAAVQWSNKLTTIGMMRNDQIGDCTCAAVAHAIQTTSSQVGAEVTMSDDDVVALYERFGYHPGDPATDRGAVEDDVLAWWAGHQVGGTALLARASVDADNLIEVCQTIWLCGGLYIGLDLPLSAQTQDVWDVDYDQNGEAGSWGGHAVWVCDYDAENLTCITWGALKKMTWRFWDAYCDEAHALLIGDWVESIAPSGFNRDALLADMNSFR
jgi:hypothetical protein